MMVMREGLAMTVTPDRLQLALRWLSSGHSLMIDAVSTYETSVNAHKTTRRNIPEDRHIHVRRRSNLKSHVSLLRYELQDRDAHDKENQLNSARRVCVSKEVRGEH